MRLALILIALWLAGCATKEPQRVEPKPVNLIVFPGGFNWPIWVAQEKGLFARHGVAPKITPTPGSAFQLTGLLRLRSKYGQPQKTLTDPARYYDDGFYRTAMR